MEDVNIVQIGGQSARVAALEAGSVDAAPVDCALTEELEAAGMNVVLRLPEVGIDFPTANLSMKRSFIEQNPNTVRAIVAANLEAMQLMFDNEDQAVQSLMAWAQLEEADARAAIQAFKAIASRNLLPTDEGYQTVKEVLAVTNPDVASVNASDAYTTTFLDELRDMGLNEELDVPAE
jgi:ABC-type nitrate/sulfonate/bicarbonate transport system substrate-binding protein